MKYFSCENFTTLDPEIIDDFYACLKEAIEEIELCCHRLDTQHNQGDIDDLFRSMHSIKGNCRMVFLDPFVDLSHKLEEIVSDIRDEKYQYQPILEKRLYQAGVRLGNLLNEIFGSEQNN